MDAGAMGSVPDVSVVIPAFGVAEWLVDGVASALGQSVSLEVIVVDDASPDDGIARRPRSRPNRGFASWRTGEPRGSAGLEIQVSKRPVLPGWCFSTATINFFLAALQRSWPVYPRGLSGCLVASATSMRLART